MTGRTASGSQWGTGAIGCAEWSGPRLADVLALAGIRADAVDVNVIGLDEAKWARPGVASLVRRCPGDCLRAGRLRL